MVAKSVNVKINVNKVGLSSVTLCNCKMAQAQSVFFLEKHEKLFKRESLGIDDLFFYLIMNKQCRKLLSDPKEDSSSYSNLQRKDDWKADGYM